MARILSCVAAIVTLIALVTVRPNFVPAPGGRTATPKSNVMGNPRVQFSAWNEKKTTEVQSKAVDGQDDRAGPIKGPMMDVFLFKRHWQQRLGY